MALTPFFHPLDAVASWNRLYGPRGFVQYQFVVPFGAELVVRRVLAALAAARSACCLTVLKRFGPGHGMLSFPIEGWTLAFDVPAAQPGLGALLDGFDRSVAEAGGRVYLAKDARLSPDAFRRMYPGYPDWLAIKQRLDPHGRFSSSLSRRLRMACP